VTPAGAGAPDQDPALRAAAGQTSHPGGTALTDHALTLAAPPSGGVVLDVGCGAGETVARLTDRYGLRGIGVEPSPASLAEGRRRHPGLPLLRGRAEALPLGSGSVDMVLAECVLSLVEAPGVALGEFARVLRPGGCLVLTDLYARDPAGTALLRALPAASCLRGARALADILGLLRRAGLRWCYGQDRSADLAAFTVQLIWGTGSASGLCCAVGSPSFPDLSRAVRAARPGYLLLIARTEGA
jgi:arsenite methyltransferase